MVRQAIEGLYADEVRHEKEVIGRYKRPAEGTRRWRPIKTHLDRASARLSPTVADR